MFLWPVRLNKIDNIVSGGDCSLVTKSCLTLATPWTVALQGPLSVEFSRQEYWSELPFPSPGDLPNPRIKFIGECTKNLENFSNLHKITGQM